MSFLCVFIKIPLSKVVSCVHCKGLEMDSNSVGRCQGFSCHFNFQRKGSLMGEFKKVIGVENWNVDERTWQRASIWLAYPPMAISLQFCRFSSRTDTSFHENRTGIELYRRRKPVSVRCSGESSAAAVAAGESDFDAKVFRKNLTRSKNYNRKGFGHKEETLELMNREYTSRFCRSDSNSCFSWRPRFTGFFYYYCYCWWRNFTFFFL